MRDLRTRGGFACAAFLGALAWGGGARAARWDDGIVRLFETLPVQDGGRIKPMHTFAGFKLLQLNGRRKCKNLAGETITPVEWMLECLFRPEEARRFRTFLVENADVLVAIGVEPRGRRDRYSYRDLEGGRDRLMQLAHQYDQVPEKRRTPLQRQVLNLAHDLLDFEGLTGFLTAARRTYEVPQGGALAEIYGGAERVSLEAAMSKGSEVFARFLALREARDQGSGGGERDARDDLRDISRFLADLEGASGRANALALFPPPSPSDKEWLTPADLLQGAFLGEEQPAAQTAMLRSLERLASAGAKEDADRFRDELESLHASVTRLARERGEYDRVGLEVTFYKAKLFYISLILYILAVVVVALGWMRPRPAGSIPWISLAAVGLPTAFLVAGIAFRCVIRSRPPVTTLYETILFITAVAVVVSLFIELANRQRIGVSVAAFLGALGVFLANKYELQDGLDTMPSMVAVLDTNFWLSTHVTTITMGYAAGLLAAAIAHIFVLGRLFGIRRDDAPFYDSITRAVYGVLCFGLLFSTVGTILGGIWANESWGRFWGWDPKENGALLIVLWQAAVLHARLGGYIREFGLHLAAIFGGVVVAFSWFGVNLLGTGLHSYGFTSGIARALHIFYWVEGGALLLGLIAWGLHRTGAPVVAGHLRARRP